MIGRIAVANLHRERTEEEQLAHDKELLEQVVSEQASRMRHMQNLSLEQRSPLVWAYLWFANLFYFITTSKMFENYILLCIILAAVLVGLEQYTIKEPVVTHLLYYIEGIVMHSFIVEFLMKLWAEGTAPWYYFVGREGSWNTFDFLIVLLSNPYITFGGGQTDGVEIFRLVRLMRLVKVFRKIPQLQMILMGLIGGLKSIAYICVLMFLTFYLYAIMGIIFFRDYNDPWHFKTISVSMLTLLRVATLDNWGNLFYINYFGCDEYPADYYYKNITELGGIFPPEHELDRPWPEDRKPVDPDWASITSYVHAVWVDETNNTKEEIIESHTLGAMAYCPEGAGNGRPVITTLYFLSFIVLASFCMLSLFVGAVSMSMSESMEKMSEEKEAARKSARRAQLETEIERLDGIVNIERSVRMQLKLLRQAFTGNALDADAIDDTDGYDNLPEWKVKMKEFARSCGKVSDSQQFQNFVTAVIILAGMQVGLGTYHQMQDKSLNDMWLIIDICILFVFAVELLLKIVAEEGRVSHVFQYGWNVFDAFILLACIFFPFLGVDGNMVMILRLLRLMRVLKLMHALPQLQVIIAALVKGISSIGFIGVLLAIFFFLFGVLAKQLFSENDPWHFATLHMSVATLFQCATLDDWTIILYINLYGCDVFGGGYYEEEPWFCDPYPRFELTALFFVVFILIVALVLLTLFIGVVSMSFEEAQSEQKTEEKVLKRVKVYAERHEISKEQLVLYREVFNLVDFTNSQSIGRQELKFGLKLAHMSITEMQFDALWNRLDVDKSDGVDFAEFLDFMIALRAELAEGNIDGNAGVATNNLSPKITPRNQNKGNYTVVVSNTEDTEENVITSPTIGSPEGSVTEVDQILSAVNRHDKKRSVTGKKKKKQSKSTNNAKNKVVPITNLDSSEDEYSDSSEEDDRLTFDNPTLNRSADKYVMKHPDSYLKLTDLTKDNKEKVSRLRKQDSSGSNGGPSTSSVDAAESSNPDIIEENNHITNTILEGEVGEVFNDHDNKMELQNTLVIEQQSQLLQQHENRNAIERITNKGRAEIDSFNDTQKHELLQEMQRIRNMDSSTPSKQKKQLKQMLSAKTKAVAETAQTLAGHAIEIAKLNESNLQEAQAMNRSITSSNSGDKSGTGSPVLYSPARMSNSTSPEDHVDRSPSHWDRYVAGRDG